MMRFNTKQSVRVMWLLMVGCLIVRPTTAAEMASGTPTKEMRQQMAQIHEKMAACLRSDRDFTECRQEMIQACGGQSGAAGCGMMMGQGMQMRSQGKGTQSQQDGAVKKP